MEKVKLLDAGLGPELADCELEDGEEDGRKAELEDAAAFYQDKWQTEQKTRMESL